MESPILSYLRDVHEELSRLRDGLPYLVGPSGASIDPDDFGIALATVDGYVYEVGTTRKEFSLQSISKPLSYGLALADLGPEAVDAKVDVEPSGDPFNEFSLNEDTGRPANAMINSGALAIASLIKGSGGRSAIRRIEESYSSFAGRALRSSGSVYRAERANSDRNHGLAYLLSSAGIIDGDPTRALETYLRQCAVQVTCRDLSVIASTLANGGSNPTTGAQALDLDSVERVLSVMMTSGMYDDAGDWVSRVGMPAKSGVGGGVIAVLPGQAGLAVFSPNLDRHGNSVRGVAACRRIARDMEMHFVRAARTGNSAIRASYRIDREPSNIRRSEAEAEVLIEHSHRAAVLELAGDLFFAGTESVVRELDALEEEVEFVVLDLRRVDEIGSLGLRMLGESITLAAGTGRATVVVDPEGLLDAVVETAGTISFDALDRAIAHCENRLLDRYSPLGARPASVPIFDASALALLDREEVAALAELMVRQHCSDGEVVRRVGQRFGGIFFILSGTVSIVASDAAGDRFRLRTLGAGMSFGDLTLGRDDREETTAKAEGPVELMVLDADAVERLERDSPHLALRLWRALARDANSRVDRLSRAVAARIRD